MLPKSISGSSVCSAYDRPSSHDCFFVRGHIPGDDPASTRVVAADNLGFPGTDPVDLHGVF